MSDTIYNPYPGLSTNLTAGLNAVATAAPTSTEDLVQAVYEFIQPLFYPVTGEVPRATELEIKSVCYNMINTYSNQTWRSMINYSDKQSKFVNMLLDDLCTVPIDSIPSWYNDVEENISKANLPIAEQTPLQLAVECGNTIYPYWVAEIDRDTSSWSTYFNAKEYRNYVNLPFWTKACVEGTLIGANATEEGLIAPTTDIVSVNIVSALIGALTLGAGKVIFDWIPQIQPAEITDDEMPVTATTNLAGVDIDDSDIPMKVRKCRYRDNVGNERKDIYVLGIMVKFFPEQ